MEAKHTKLPWFISRDPREGMEWNNHIGCAADPNLEVCSMFHDATPENELGEANAALIVRAVNNHDALVSIAERWAALDGGAWHVERYQREREELLAATRSALLSAKAKP